MKPVEILIVVASIVSIPASVVFLGDRFGLWSVFNNLNLPAIAFLAVVLADFYLGSKQSKYF
jgi:hypothetical protein